MKHRLLISVTLMLAFAGCIPHGEYFCNTCISDLSADITHGTYLMVVMSTMCSHCQECVPRLNEIWSDERLPALVAVAPEGPIVRSLFRVDYHAQFPVGNISQDYFREQPVSRYPRICLMRDGLIERSWSGEVPSNTEILAQLESLGLIKPGPSEGR
jgi:hypothetical protein